MTAAFLAIVGFAFLIGPKVEGFLHRHRGDADLEVAEVGVVNVPAEFVSLGEGENEQVPSTEPKIEATVRNLGDETAWIEEARVTVIDSARFPTCLNQGGGTEVPRSKPYEVKLPDFPASGRRMIRRDLHVEVPPGRGARPVLALHNSGIDTSDLYALRVELVSGPGGRVLDAGRFVIGVPDPVDRGGQVLPEDNGMLLSDATHLGETLPAWCFRHNLNGLRRLVSEPGTRSAYVTALAHVQPAPAWHSYAAAAPPPRAAIPELLGSGVPEAAVFAVEAAEQTGDSALEANTRERAVRSLLRLGREELADGFPQVAVENAERTLSLQRSAAAKHLLWRAEAAERG